MWDMDSLSWCETVDLGAMAGFAQPD